MSRQQARDTLRTASGHLFELWGECADGAQPIYERALGRVRRAIEDLDMIDQLEQMRTEDLQALANEPRFEPDVFMHSDGCPCKADSDAACSCCIWDDPDACHLCGLCHEVGAGCPDLRGWTDEDDQA